MVEDLECSNEEATFNGLEETPKSNDSVHKDYRAKVATKNLNAMGLAAGGKLGNSASFISICFEVA